VHTDNLIDLTEEEFRKISQLVYTRFGINLTEKKKVLVKGRLNKLIREMGLSSFSEYHESILNDSGDGSLLTLVDKISTNHTYFFRENDHFELLAKTVLPEMERRFSATRSKDLRIWCAGCASGEEAYTMAIVLRENLESSFFKDMPLILATDISLSALGTADKGVYPVERLAGIPENIRKRYFIQESDTTFRVADSLRKLVLFKRLNFINERYPFKQRFHLIFCRNVMIYFDAETKNRLIEKFHAHLDDDGYLFIGHSETLNRDLRLFSYVQPAAYRKMSR
jgi:chemotaxis protein methyltransferase CheR